LDDRADESLFLACRRGDKTTHSTLAQRHYRRIFALCLDELRLPLVLFYFENRDVEGIAGTLGVSQFLVYERLRVAREQLHAVEPPAMLSWEGDSGTSWICLSS
jgi:DNA-directed RNA polymerase specialized sigma24 family protein